MNFELQRLFLVRTFPPLADGALSFHSHDSPGQIYIRLLWYLWVLCIIINMVLKIWKMVLHGLITTLMVGTDVQLIVISKATTEDYSLSLEVLVDAKDGLTL